MQSEKSKDVWLGVFILAIALIGFLFVNPTNAPVTDGPGGVSWRTIPYMYSGLLLVLAILFIAITLINGPIPVDEVTSEETGVLAEEDALEHAPEPMVFGIRLSTARRVGVIGSLIIYSQAFKAFGFAMTTPVFLFVVLFLFGRKDLRENLLVATIGGFAFWFLFDYLLKMPLRGDLWDPVSPALSAAIKALGG